jgi:uncharacterized protein (TIRG00374 family)
LKAHAFRALRILLSVVLLVVVFRMADFDQVRGYLGTARKEWLLAAFAVNSAGNLFGAWRWKLLLASQGRKCSFPYLFGSYLVGLFFNNFLPSTIGGDVARAASARRRGGGTLTENLTVVLVERMIGLLATLSLGTGAALSGLAGDLDARLTGVLAAAFLVSVLGLYLALSARIRHRMLAALERLPESPREGGSRIARLATTVLAFARRTIGKMLAAFELFSRARGTLVANFLLSLSFQFLLIVHFWLIQFALGQDLPFTTYLVTVPIVFCAMMLPVGINGLGVREYMFVLLLSRAGMDQAAALAISVMSYGIAVLQGLLGGGVHLARELRGRRSALSEPDDTPPALEP